jgi:hypothetical protein
MHCGYPKSSLKLFLVTWVKKPRCGKVDGRNNLKGGWRAQATTVASHDEHQKIKYKLTHNLTTQGRILLQIGSFDSPSLVALGAASAPDSAYARPCCVSSAPVVPPLTLSGFAAPVQWMEKAFYAVRERAAESAFGMP